MTLKTFNLNEKLYREFSQYCKKHGISMSKRIENFIGEELERIKLDVKVFQKEITSKARKFKDLKNEEHPIGRYC